MNRRSSLIPLVIRWTARVLGFLVFLFWGAFFVEHLVEWFSDPSNLPPMRVFLMQGLHFLMLAGFIISWKWEIPGAVLIIAASGIFFFNASGGTGGMFMLFWGITAVPAILHIVAWELYRRRSTATITEGKAKE